MPLKYLIVLCSAFAVTAFGQSGAITWSNLSATIPPGGNFGRSTNWIGDDGLGGHAPATGVICAFDGLTPGDLRVYSLDGIDGAGSANAIGNEFGPNGISLHLTSNQTGSVTLYATNTAVGMGFNNIQVDPGAGKLILGDNTANQLIIALRPSSGVHVWKNNTTNPTIVNPSFQIQFAGGTAHLIDFQGTGDFCITNNLRNNNKSPAGSVRWESTGTMTWAAGGTNDKFNDAGLSNVFFNAGAVVIKSNGLLPIVPGGKLTNNATLLKLDAAATAQDAFGFPIHGAGGIQVNSGTWKFSSPSNSFTGNLLLSGGELIADANENAGVSGPLGVGGTISFTGGTLGFSPSNAFDYSPRFSAAIGQSYSIDTGGQNIVFTNATGLGGAGNTLSKFGLGALAVSGPSTYTGATTIHAGKLAFQGTKSGSGDISLSDGSTLGLTATGTQVTPATLTVGTNSGATLEFYHVNSTTTPIIAASTFSATGTLTINLTCGTLLGGQSYPLLSWVNGPAPVPILGTVNGDPVNWPNCLRLDAGAKLIFLVPPPTLNLTNNGNSLQLSWTDSIRDFKLQVRTNLLDANWSDYPGGITTPVTVPNMGTNATMFFRLISVP